MTEPVATQRPASARKNLLLRLVTAAVLAPFTLALAYAGGAWWALLVTLVAVGLLAEWDAIVGVKALSVLGLGAFGLLVAGGLCAFGRFDLALVSVFCAAAAAALLAPDRRGWIAAGVFYAATPLLAALVLRRSSDYGFSAVLFVLLLVWTTDSGGYFVGRALGGPKLWPRVSPGKTWAGAAGGLAAAMLAAAVFATTQSLRLPPLLAVAGLLSVAAQAGDLLESAVKRRFGVKDSGRLIPGHGGLLDRLDGVIAAMLVAALMGAARYGADGAGRGLMLW